MEYSIDSFVNRLREVLYDNFPFESEEINEKKHKKRPLHIRDIAFINLPIAHSFDTLTFDIGSPYAEENYPYYHILQDSQVIHIRGKGTKSSKGSQDRVSDLQARDYGRVKWNGKTYTQEYKKNVRGSRSKFDKARRTFVDSNGVVYKINETATTYVNIHYKYIDRILDNTLPWIATEFGMKLKRKQDTGLGEEMGLQANQDDNLDFAGGLIDILNSFGEEDYD